ncbi:MAG: methyltransferase domain-containing protein [Acidobacteria bacterium]|nr:methyltransferase domain-containing protein [Acidobacteriota bacterium]
MQMTVSSERRVNLGCGGVRRATWINFDADPAGKDVLMLDVRTGLPLGDRSVAVVYCSHLLEHLECEDASRLVGEAFRVLEPGGVFRVVVPDLEMIVRCYLEALEACLDAPSVNNVLNHSWMVTELVDQIARDRSGGRMATLLADPDLTNRDFVVGRVGENARSSALAETKSGWRRRLEAMGPLAWVSFATRRLALRSFQALVPSQLANDIEVGRFRRCGEVHRWLYDRFSLSALLRQQGFDRVVRQEHNTSIISDWMEDSLDTTEKGEARKPDSLYMEGIRPA